MDEFGYEQKLARAYYKLLTSLDWQDDILIAGLSEGLNKFLSNAYLNCFRGKKYHKTHFVSQKALDKLQRNDCKELVFEHIVPKRKYLQSLCEERAKQGSLTIDYIEDLLKKYWHLATITKEEDASLAKNMPDEWDEKDIFARYNDVDIVLVENPYFKTKYKEDKKKVF